MSQVDKLAATIAKMQRDIADLQRAPQLGNSSVEGTITIVDPATGHPAGAIGQLPDGSFGVGVYTGPTPPQPTPPILTPAQGGLNVKWDGRFLDPETGVEVTCPGFARVEVHIGDHSGFYPEHALAGSAYVGPIDNPLGGTFAAIPLKQETKYVVLVARNTAGGNGPPSEERSAQPGSFVSDDEVQQIADDLEENAGYLATLKGDLQQTVGIAERALTTADGKGRVWYTPDPPTATGVYDIWFDIDNDNKPHQWNGSTWVEQPLGNAAIGNLTAAKITFGEMHGDRIEANTMVGDRIIANTLEGDRIIANTLDADRIIANTITGDLIMANEIVGIHIRSRNIETDHLAVGAVKADEIDVNAIEARHIKSDAITGKVITGGVFRTGIATDRIEIVNELQYDAYLQVFRELRDSIRWIRGADNALVGEVRGYMGDIGAYGLHLNSHLEVGNTGSVTYMVGKRKMLGAGIAASVRTRAGTVSVSVSGGIADISFDSGLSESPQVLHVQCISRAMAVRVASRSANGFTIECAVGASPPGNGVYSFSYFAEVVV